MVFIWDFCVVSPDETFTLDPWKLTCASHTSLLWLPFPVGGQEVCTAHLSEAAPRLSCTPVTPGQGKAAMEVESQNAPLPQDHSKVLQSQCLRQGVLWVCWSTDGYRSTIYYGGIKLSSLPVIHSLSSARCGGSLRSPRMDLRKQEFSMHCEVQHSFPD